MREGPQPLGCSRYFTKSLALWLRLPLPFPPLCVVAPPSHSLISPYLPLSSKDLQLPTVATTANICGNTMEMVVVSTFYFDVAVL